MTEKEIRFVEEYTVDCKGAAAAVRAGYDAKRARQTAWELKQNPEIKAAIDERLKALSLTAEEATKNISDIARTRLQEFMIVKKVLKTPIVRKPLALLIKELEAEIEREKEFFELADLTEKEQDIHHRDQQDRKRKILRYQIELRQNPKAYRDGPGESKWEDEMRLDLVALARAKDIGNINELSFNEFGPKVKMYAADKANEMVLKLNGKLIDRHDHTNNGKSFGDFLIDVSTDE